MVPAGTCTWSIPTRSSPTTAPSNRMACGTATAGTPDSSTNCTIFACEFCTGDDAVAIKSGKNPEGNATNRPTKHVRVFDCHSGFGHGICIGSEMSGGVEDVKIWDCNMAVSTSGLEIKATKKRGGYVRDVEVCDCTLSHVMVHSVGYNDDGIGSDVPPILENFKYERSPCWVGTSTTTMYGTPARPLSCAALMCRGTK